MKQKKNIKNLTFVILFTYDVLSGCCHDHGVWVLFLDLEDHEAVLGGGHVLLRDLAQANHVPLLAAAQGRHNEPRVPVLQDLWLGLVSLFCVFIISKR